MFCFVWSFFPGRYKVQIPPETPPVRVCTDGVPSEICRGTCKSVTERPKRGIAFDWPSNVEVARFSSLWHPFLLVVKGAVSACLKARRVDVHFFSAPLELVGRVYHASRAD